jgi:hypothetical protein
MGRRDKGFLAELFPLGRVYLKDSVCAKDDAIAIVEGSARSRHRPKSGRRWTRHFESTCFSDVIDE